MGVILQAPLDGIATTTELPNPQFSNVEQALSTITLLRARNGDKYTYVKRRERKRLLWSFSLTREKAFELRAFLIEYYPHKIRIVDFNGDTWIGVIKSNPGEFQVLDRDRLFHETVNFTLELEAVKVAVASGGRILFANAVDELTNTEATVTNVARAVSASDNLTVSEATSAGRVLGPAPSFDVYPEYIEIYSNSTDILIPTTSFTYPGSATLQFNVTAFGFTINPIITLSEVSGATITGNGTESVQIVGTKAQIEDELLWPNWSINSNGAEEDTHEFTMQIRIEGAGTPDDEVILDLIVIPPP